MVHGLVRTTAVGLVQASNCRVAGFNRVAAGVGLVADANYIMTIRPIIRA
jgi:hypothetical protein